MKVAVGLRRVAAGKRTSGRRAAQIAGCEDTRKKGRRNNKSQGHCSGLTPKSLSAKTIVVNPFQLNHKNLLEK